MKKLIFCIILAANIFALNYQYAGKLTNNIISPFGVTFQSNNIYSSVGADIFSDSVCRISVDGNILNKWGEYGTYDGEFDFPAYLDFDSSNRLWVADENNDRIQIFDYTGIFFFTSGSYGSQLGNFYQPTGIAIDGSNIFVAEEGNHRIQKLVFEDEELTGITQWGSLGTGPGEFGDRNFALNKTGLGDVAIDNYGFIYVVDGGNNRIQKFNQNGIHLLTFGGYGTIEGKLYGPTGIDFTDNKFIAVAERYNQRVQLFSTNGEFIATVGNNSYFTYPADVASAPDKTLYITDYEKDTIFIFKEGTPEFFGLPPTVIAYEQEEISFPIAGIDPNNDNLFFAISNSPADATIIQVSGTNFFKWTPNGLDAGTHQIGLFIFDDGQPNIATNFEIVSFTILDTNHAPVISTSLPISPYSILEGQNLQFNIIMFDKDYDNLTLISNGVPENAEISKINGTNYLFNWMPDFDDGSISGTDYPMTFWAVDNGIPNLSNSVSVTITVIGTNDPPKIVPLTDKFLNENEILNFNITAFDPNGDNLSFAVSNAPLNSTFSQFLSSSTNYLFSWAPGFTDAGIYSNIEFYVTDDSLTPATVVEEINIIVSNVNRIPVLNIDNIIIDEGSNWIMAVVATDPDVDDILNYSAFGFPAGVSWTNNCFEWLPDYDESGIYPDWKVIVNDGYVSVTSTFSVTVFNMNSAPGLSGPSEIFGIENQEISFAITGTPHYGYSVYFEITNEPTQTSTFTFQFSNNIFSINWMPDFSDAGYYTNIIIYAWENFPDKASEFAVFPVSIIVTNVNHAPTLVALKDKTWYSEIPYSLQLIASDEDTNDQLTFSVDNNPPSLSIDTNTGLISCTPLQSELGLYSNIIFTVTDNGGRKEMPGSTNLSASVLFNLLIKGTNEPPEVIFTRETSSGWQPVYGTAEVFAKQLIRLKIPKNDINNDELSVIENELELPEGALFNTNTWIISWIPKNSQSTESGREISITVQDNGEPPQSTEASVIIIVHALPETAQIKDEEFYDIDGDKVLIKYKSKGGGAIDIRDPKNIKITGGNGKENLLIKTGKTKLPEQYFAADGPPGDQFFDVEKIESETALNKIKIKGSLSGLDIPEVKSIILDGDLTGKIIVRQNVGTIVTKQKITDAELWIGVGTAATNPASGATTVKKIMAKDGIEKSKIMIGLSLGANPTNTLSVGQLKQIKTKSLTDTIIATGLPTNKKGKTKELKIKSKETSNSVLFKTEGNAVTEKPL